MRQYYKKYYREDYLNNLPRSTKYLKIKRRLKANKFSESDSEDDGPIQVIYCFHITKFVVLNSNLNYFFKLYYYNNLVKM